MLSLFESLKLRLQRRRNADRLAAALGVVVSDMLGATDFGMPVSDEDHPFHESVKEARAALVEYRELSR